MEVNEIMLKDSRTRPKTIKVVFHFCFQELIEISRHAALLQKPCMFVFVGRRRTCYSTKNKCQLQPMQLIQNLVESCETQEFWLRLLKPESVIH